jgi:hypothetical protein
MDLPLDFFVADLTPAHLCPHTAEFLSPSRRPVFLGSFGPPRLFDFGLEMRHRASLEDIRTS